MAQADPTLPATPDVDLVTQVKATQDSTALTALIERHSGIYFKIVNSYAASYPNVIRRAEMNDDKMFNMYQFILAYDPTRGMKLCSYIGDRTDYLCKTMLRKDDRDPLSLGYVASGGAAPSVYVDNDGESRDIYQTDDTFVATHGTRVVLTDESMESNVTDNANQDVAIEDIRRAATEITTDTRFLDILQFRHFNAPRAALSWRDIGARLNLSHERVRMIYNENLARVKAYLLSQLTPVLS